MRIAYGLPVTRAVAEPPEEPRLAGFRAKSLRPAQTSFLNIASIGANRKCLLSGRNTDLGHMFTTYYSVFTSA